MRSEAMKSKMLYDRPLPTQRIVNAIADSKLQIATENSSISLWLTHNFYYFRGTSKYSTIWT
jgi:hypothetical protein